MKTLIVDANGLAHKVRHSYKGLSWEGGNTNVLYGFVSQILKLSNKFETNRFVFCWDSSESKREEIYPGYKKSRKAKKNNRTPEEVQQDKNDFEQMGQLQNGFLSELGFTWNFEFEGFEGDDLIASAVENNSGEFVVVSTDHDMYQLLNKADMYFTKGKKEKLLTKETFEKDYGISPSDWTKVLAIAGCKTDEVVGIRGVGETSALKWLRGEANKAVNTKVVMGMGLMEENLKLVKLPFEGTPKVKIPKENPTFSASNIIQTMEQYGMYSLTGKKFSEKWKWFI